MRCRRLLLCYLAGLIVFPIGRCLADPTLLEWPPETRAIFAGSIVNGLYVLGPSVANGFAMSDDGSLCTFDPKTSDALVFPKLGSDRTTGELVRAKIGRMPAAVAFKRWKDRAFFLVACNPDHSLYVIDAHEGKLLNTIVASADLVNYLAAPADADVPFVYYSGGDSAKGQPGKIGRIDLGSMSDAGLIAMPDRFVMDIAVSHDGKMLYARRPNASPMGFTAMGVVDDMGPVHVKVYHDEPSNHPRIIPCPNADIVASGHTLYSNTLADKLHDFTDWPLAFSVSKSAIFTVAEDWSISIFGLTRRELLGTFPAPFTPSPAAAAAQAKAPDSPPLLALFCDEVHGELIVLNAAHLAVIPLDPLKTAASTGRRNHGSNSGSPPITASLARVDVTGETTMTAGKPWSATLHPSDPAMQIELHDPPTGLSLRSNKLLWTPAVTDIGDHPVTLNLTMKGQHFDQSLTLSVKRGGIAVPFIADALSVSADGHRALIAQLHGDHRNRRHDDEQVARLALIDLDHGAVIADRTLLAPLRSAGIDDRFAYAGLQNSSAFVAMSLRDLSDVKRVFTAGPVWQFQFVGERLFPSISGKTMIWYSLPSLNPDPDAPPADPLQNSSTPQPIALNGGWFVDGVIYDQNASHVKWIEHDAVFPSLNRNGRAFEYSNNTEMPAGPWDAEVANSSIRRIGGQQIFQITTAMDGLPMILRDLPVVADISRHQTPSADPSTPTIVTQIDLFQLATGDRLDPIVLDAASPRKDPDIRDVPHLAANGHRVVAQVLDRLYVLPTSDIPASNLPMPFTVIPPEGTVTIPADRPTPIQLTATGGKKPYLFGLSEEVPGVQIDPASGMLTVDPAPLMSHAKDGIIQSSQSRFGYDPKQNRPLSPQEALIMDQHFSSSHFKTLTGANTAGFTVALSLTINARDAEQMPDQRPLTLLIDVPMATVMPPATVPATIPTASPTTSPATIRTPTTRSPLSR